MSTSAFTLVVPTRDDPARCAAILQHVADELRRGKVRLPIDVLFLVNDTRPDASAHMNELVRSSAGERARARVVFSDKDHLTVEENIRHNLLAALETVGERFLIIGNSDRVDLAALERAVQYMTSQQADLLLIGVLNRELWEGKPVRELYATPRHVDPKNELPAVPVTGADVFRRAMTDFGPFDYLAYIGCQIYTQAFFRDLCAIELAEPLYALPVATLEATSRKEYRVGFFPDVVMVRTDHLQAGPSSPEQPAHWWVIESRTKRGLSRNVFMSVITNSLGLRQTAFDVLVNAQMVSMKRGSASYIYWNFLASLVRQTLGALAAVDKDPTFQFTQPEIADFVRFAKRLQRTDLGLPAQAHSALCSWLQRFDVLVDGHSPKDVATWKSLAPQALAILNARPKMGMWLVDRFG